MYICLGLGFFEREPQTRTWVLSHIALCVGVYLASSLSIIIVYQLLYCIPVDVMIRYGEKCSMIVIKFCYSLVKSVLC